MLFLQHIWELVLFVIILLGPLPLCLWLLSISQSDKHQFKLIHGLLISLNYWCGTQVSVSLFLGTIGQLFLVPTIVFELIIFLLGVALHAKTKRRLKLAALKNSFKLRGGFTNPEILILTSVLLAGMSLVFKLTTQVIID